MTRVHGCARGRSDGDCEIRSGRGEGRGKERSLEEENRGERTEGERKTKRREMNESRNRGGEEEITSRDGIEHVASEGRESKTVASCKRILLLRVTVREHRSKTERLYSRE